MKPGTTSFFQLVFLAPSGFVREAAEKFWQPQTGALQQDFPCRVFHYESHTQFGAAAAELLKHIAAEPTLLVGCSLGSMVVIEALRQAAHTAATHSILGACLISVAAKAETPERAAHRMEITRQYLEKPETRAEPIPEHRMRLMIDTQHNGHAAQILQALIQQATWLDLAHQNMLVAQRPDQQAILKDLGRFPVLIVGGENDTTLTPIDGMRDMQRHISGAKFLAIRRCGHLPPLEKPAEVTSIIRSFALSMQASNAFSCA